MVLKVGANWNPAAQLIQRTGPEGSQVRISLAGGLTPKSRELGPLCFIKFLRGFDPRGNWRTTGVGVWKGMPRRGGMWIASQNFNRISTLAS